jgi:UDP-N-acetylglucosamine 2-epimerase (non-hydrolysing)
VQRRLVLVTAHRRENWGDGFAAICRAIRRLADAHNDIEVLFCLHPNPELQATAASILGGHARITLSLPRPYVKFIGLLARAYLVLSDSGGVQEEATALGKPVLLLRDTTERPEGVTAGTVRLVGTAEQTIVSVADGLLQDGSAYAVMARPSECFGDGFASERIVQEIGCFFGQTGRLAPWVPTGVDVPSLFGAEPTNPLWCS